MAENNELVNPEYYEIKAEPYDISSSFRIEGLAPGTTYYADLSRRITQDPYPPDSFTGPDTVRTSFTTESDAGDRSAKPSEKLVTRTDDPNTVSLRPNPASSEVNVSISSGELETVLLMDTDGRTVKRAAASGQSTTLGLEGLPPGAYWVRTVRTDRTPLTVLLVKR